MTKQHHEVATEQQAHGRDEAPRSAGQPATAMVQQLLASGARDPKEVAAIIEAHPAAANEIFALLHRTAGNRFASEVSAIVVGKGGLGAPRDAVSFDQSSEYRESRATIDGPPKQEAEFLALQEEIFDADSKESEFLALQEEIFDADSKESASRFGADSSSDQTADGPAKAAAPKNRGGNWVTRAQRYNRAHAAEVAAFLEATGNACIDEATGEADPRKVARWQASNGLPPDGRIGRKTHDLALINAV